LANDLFDYAAAADSTSPPDAVADNAAVTSCEVRGEVLRLIFASDDGQYVVLRLRDLQNQELTVVGALGGVVEGQDLQCTGRWETHPQHGRQLHVSAFRAILPSTQEGICRYLSSGIIPGIGPKMAERIVDKFGSKTLDVLDHYTDRLLHIPGIGRKRASQIHAGWQEQTQQRDVHIFLQGLGLGPGICARIVRQYGVGAGEVVKANAYRLAHEVKGIGFILADRIARRLGVALDDPQRLCAGIVYVLQQLADQGNCCYPRPALLAAAAERLEVDAAGASIGLDRAIANAQVVVEKIAGDEHDLVYARELHVAETSLSATLAALLQAPPAIDLRRMRFGGGMYGRLNISQQAAVQTAFQAPVSLLTGGPGVGKTTVIGEIVRHARDHGMYVLLAAPTGRAAKRLSDSSRLEAKTIHRLLRWDPRQMQFYHNQQRPLKCNMLIVDEVSMLDIPLAEQLLTAIGANTHLVLVGDPDQLPSVGPGAFLHDLITSGLIPVTHLTDIYRQGENSRIVSNAHLVNRGMIPDLSTLPPDVQGDFYWVEQDDPERAVAMIVKLLAERIPQRFGFDPLEDVQVLVPMNRGSCGTIRLNETLQHALNPGPKPEFRYGERRFRLGDRVMQISNNYDKGVFNGDLGRIQAINSSAKTCSILFEAGCTEYEWAEVDQLRLSYAVTVHKSQGCEFPVVIMPVLNQHYMMLQRNLIYTGMTRARQLLVMLGSHKALALAVRNEQRLTRHSGLQARLLQHLARQPRVPAVTSERGTR